MKAHWAEGGEGVSCLALRRFPPTPVAQSLVPHQCGLTVVEKRARGCSSATLSAPHANLGGFSGRNELAKVPPLGREMAAARAPRRRVPGCWKKLSDRTHTPAPREWTHERWCDRGRLADPAALAGRRQGQIGASGGATAAPCAVSNTMSCYVAMLIRERAERPFFFFFAKP